MYRGEYNLLGFATAAAALCAVGGVSAAAWGLRWERVGQNETAIETRNGVIYDDNIKLGLNYDFAWLDKIEFPKISHATQSFAVTAVDRGEKCGEDCVTLQTADQQTVTGSLGVQWHIDRNHGPNGSVAAELFNLRGATSTHDIQEKFLVPQFINCMIGKINKTNASALVEKSDDFVEGVKACVAPRVLPYHIVVEEVFDRGFGPSTEARASMRRFADAKQDGQVAAIQLKTADERQAAALKNAEIFAAIRSKLVEKGMPTNEALQAACLVDTNSKERPCVPFTAMGGAVPTFAYQPK